MQYESRWEACLGVFRSLYKKTKPQLTLKSLVFIIETSTACTDIWIAISVNVSNQCWHDLFIENFFYVLDNCFVFENLIFCLDFKIIQSAMTKKIPLLLKLMFLIIVMLQCHYVIKCTNINLWPFLLCSFIWKISIFLLFKHQCNTWWNPVLDI